MTHLLHHNVQGYTSVSFLNTKLHFTKNETGSIKHSAEALSLEKRNQLHDLISASYLKKAMAKQASPQRKLSSEKQFGSALLKKQC